MSLISQGWDLLSVCDMLEFTIKTVLSLMLNEDLTKIDFISAVGQDVLRKYIRENFDGNDSSFKEFFKTVGISLINLTYKS